MSGCALPLYHHASPGWCHTLLQTHLLFFFVFPCFVQNCHSTAIVPDGNASSLPERTGCLLYFVDSNGSHLSYIPFLV
jgi:hypothetical protein